MELAVLIGLLFLFAIPFVMPIVSLVAARQVRERVNALEQRLAEQERDITALTNHVQLLRKQARDRGVPTAAPIDTAADAADAAARAPAPKRAPVPPPIPEADVREPIPPREPVPPPAAALPPIATPPPATTLPPAGPPPAAAPPSADEAPPRPSPPPPRRPDAPSARPPFVPPPIVPPPPPPPSPPGFALPAFDWEQLVGVRLFSAIAGVALVLAGVFFLRYSIEHGWLQPPVRVAIGTLTGIALLVVCERKAARRYAVTANALDAAAIAILFSTFFAAHALWQLISAGVAFGLLGLVTATAVLLSIRRESLFIAVLGLLGGFATPILLSSGQNNPIGLFSYLMLLNIGLAWVAYRHGWPTLSGLSMVLTTLYQWGWVMKYLDASQLSLAAGIFIAFAGVGFAGLLLSGAKADPDDQTFQKLGLGAAIMPLFFAIYLAAVPAYRDNFWLLFGFLLLVDAGLLAIALARREARLHAAGALLTIIVFAVWSAVSYSSAAWPAVAGIVAVFVLFYLFAPDLAARLERPFEDLAASTIFAAPILLFPYVVVAAREPAAASPALLFATVLILLAAIAWRAIARGIGPVYYTGAFFTLVAEAVWSQRFLQPERLGAALATYGAFALIYLGVPLVARRVGRPLQPPAAAGIVAVSSLIVLLFLTWTPVAAAAIWGLALLLAIVNAGVFIESAAARVPALSLAASIGSWLVLALWWMRAGAAVGLLASLLVLVGLTLVMLLGYAWTRRQMHAAGAATDQVNWGFYLAMVGHLFLWALALQPEWSIPPWPLFGALTVMTLAVLVTSLAFREIYLYGAAVIAAALVIGAFTVGSNLHPWPTVALAGFAVVGGVAVMWLWLIDGEEARWTAAAFAMGTLVIGMFGGMAAVAQPAPPSVWWAGAWYVTACVTMLALIARYEFEAAASGVALLAGLAVGSWVGEHPQPEDWRSQLGLAAALYAVFVAHPLLLGRRAAVARDPYVAAIVASAWAFLAGRHAVDLGELDGIVGVVPVILALVMAVLLRQLIRVPSAGPPDLARLALVAGTALAFVTVAIPLQLEEQWITIGWALEGAALAWLFTRIPHRGLLYAATALLAVVFVRLAANPAVLQYEPRGALPIWNWYLYTYALAAAAMFLATWWLTRTDDRLQPDWPRVSHLSAAGGGILLFVLLNIEIADFYATGPTIVFRFGESIAQDLTYTIGWLVFGLATLATGIILGSRATRSTAVALMAVTTFKCFLYDLASLEGLYRAGAMLGLAISLTLVSLALQKFVLKPQRHAA